MRRAPTTRPARTAAAAPPPPAPSPSCLSSAPAIDLAATPLPGRESEFERVVAFVHERLLGEHERTLFLCGACGCGKTSTVLRALRSFHVRPLPCDRQALNESTSTAAAVAVKRPRTRSPPSAGPHAKAVRQEKTRDGLSSATSTPSPRTSTTAGAGSAEDASDVSPDTAAALPRRLFHEVEEGVAALHARYPALYAAVVAREAGSGGKAGARTCTTAARRTAATAVAQGHYVNGADMSPQQLAEALHASLRLAYPRPSASLAAFIAEVRELPQTSRRPRGQDGARVGGRAGMPLQVLVLDEVEYLRPAARAVLATLASVAFQRTWRFALICISNQRDLVHVPQMSLEELAFTAYDAEALRDIGRAVAEEEIAKWFGAEATPAVTISPSLYEYVARKALLEYAGDVRQVAAMCRRVVYTAWEQWRARPTVVSDTMAGVELPEKRRRVAAAASAAAVRPRCTPEDALASKLEAVVDTYNAPTGSRGSGGSSSSSSSTRTSTSSSSSTGAGAATPSSAAACADQRRCDVSLASSMRVIKGSAVQDHLRQHLDTMPEQTLYLLSCLMVLSLRRERENRGAAVAVGGRPVQRRVPSAGRASASSSSSSVVSSTAITQRDTHELYMRLMARHHFPPMNGAGVATAMSYLADLHIITRPQQRGNEEVFSLSGAWSMEAMETALIERGEALRRELEACGLDGSENRFANVLRELKTLAGLTF